MTDVKKLSIVIPVYNEEKTILLLLEKVKATILIEGIEKEIIIINDCSTDHTEENINTFIERDGGSSSGRGAVGGGVDLIELLAILGNIALRSIVHEGTKNQ